MGKEKHSPGPWACYGYHVVKHGYGTVRTTWGDIVPTDRAIVERCEGGTDAEALANARLIASAPMLLAACRLAFDALGDGSATEINAKLMLHDAIEQATGMEG